MILDLALHPLPEGPLRIQSLSLDREVRPLEICWTFIADAGKLTLSVILGLLIIVL